MRDRKNTVVPLACTLLLGACVEQPTDTFGENEGELTSASGITVTGSRWITARTLEADISTPYIAARAVNGPHRIRITLPNDYAQSTQTSYPVIYLLHGGAGGSSAQWTTQGGAAEAITDGKPVITVMPDGGKVGWFTNWVDQSGGAQRWADFYIDQVIPWVDTNFRTVKAKNGRAIAGLSMGGYGAVRLAQDRPDLFASVASFSGAVNLGDLGTRTVVTEQAFQYGFNPIGVFGNPLPPNDAGWKPKDPVKRAAQLAGVQVLLYAGAGTNDVDILERTMGQSAHKFSKALTTAGVPHHWWMYGRPGPAVPFGCDGGHNFSCWNFAFDDALPKMMTVLAVPSSGPGLGTGVNAVKNAGFESAQASWACSGNCGTDANLGFSHGGAGNGWVRASQGWNDIHQLVTVQPNRNYQVSAWIKTSAASVDGYVGLRTVFGQVVGEQHFANLLGYTHVTFTVSSGANTSLYLFAGFWANGDSWIQVDDVSVAAL